MNALRFKEFPGQRGTTLVECLIATGIGVALVAVFGHTLLTHQAAYRDQLARLDTTQQADFALTLITDELHAAVQVIHGEGCPEPGGQIQNSQISFAANLYDHTTELREQAPSAQSNLVVRASSVFEVNDLVMIVGVGDPADPSDDVAECREIDEIVDDRVTVHDPLSRSYPLGSPVSVLNRVRYVYDAHRGRLMRSQDGSSQRIAQGVTAFSVEGEGPTIVVSLGLRASNPAVRSRTWQRRVVLEDRR
jgi:Tfp pilus assembly protein PilW